MCLMAIGEARLGHTAPTRTRAYKMVDTDRTPYFIGGLPGTYDDGTVHEVSRDKVIERMDFLVTSAQYNFGLHVYTDDPRTNEYWMFSATTWTCLEVEVAPEDWVADGTRGEAVYTKIKIIGEVK